MWKEQLWATFLQTVKSHSSSHYTRARHCSSHEGDKSEQKDKSLCPSLYAYGWRVRMEARKKKSRVTRREWWGFTVTGVEGKKSSGMQVLRAKGSWDAEESGKGIGTAKVAGSMHLLTQDRGQQTEFSKDPRVIPQALCTIPSLSAFLSFVLALGRQP